MPCSKRARSHATPAHDLPESVGATFISTCGEIRGISDGSQGQGLLRKISLIVCWIDCLQVPPFLMPSVQESVLSLVPLMKNIQVKSLHTFLKACKLAFQSRQSLFLCAVTERCLEMSIGVQRRGEELRCVVHRGQMVCQRRFHPVLQIVKRLGEIKSLLVHAVCTVRPIPHLRTKHRFGRDSHPPEEILYGRLLGR